MPDFKAINKAMDSFNSFSWTWSGIPAIPEGSEGFYGQFEYVYLEEEHYVVRHAETKGMWFVQARSPKKAVDALPRPAKDRAVKDMFRQAKEGKDGR